MGRSIEDHPLLSRIVRSKQTEVEASEHVRPVSLLEQDVSTMREQPLSPRVAWAGGKKRLRVIAETKKKSPSRGVIREPYDPMAIVSGYLMNGASGISVLTDGPFFGGHPDDLRLLKEKLARETRVPFLRKDFLILPYQIWESRCLGADIVLLIARILSFERLSEMIALSRRLGLSALVEVHSREELDMALDAGSDLVGINHRDLDSLVIDLGLSEKLAPHIPKGVLRVAESGLKTPEDRKRMEDLGYDAVLVGESFLTAPDPGVALKEFLRDVD
ncbi:indole-3-glycerol phosphate synthase TrpC [Leptospirillum ferriphilum]|jgi:indole-3-glycerol phosphate synthase|uniref:indole-3-glycerol phosphate synthase TrpC n=1 Tax=Leptospirillum ferriphilum TaxID=178606 RepID=UPI0005704FD6|nr:indole-3-glycerol phosphate synthase TrpC [Leptospirillum ferriphilum]MCL4405774.1 indole-3-glycerol phosphate synthase TrpC [Bacillota bacterium]OOH76277.1 indole-3-glycerol phosphate synthase [Leptospirillum ferriphilum]